LALLADKVSIVRLNAATAFQRIKDPSCESALTVAVSDINPSIQEAALRALGFQGTPTALTTIRQVLRFNPDEYAKSVAARMLAATGDTKYAGDVLLLFTTRGWQPKIAAIEAISQLDKLDPKFRLGFLRNEDPAVRLAVIDSADVKNSETVSALEWHAVNDPSDLIRARACLQLIASGNQAAMDQGYAGVKDDSKLVRLMILSSLADKPAESHRKALQLAVADRNASVRAAALTAYAKFPADVTLEEIANVLQDDDPDVQLALLRLAKAKNLTLPSETIAKMKASPDPRVVQAAGT
jgi:HEAT repeat protein